MNNSDNSLMKEYEAFAQSNFQNIELVFNFAEKHKNSVTSIFPKPETHHRDICIKGLWSRVYFWLYSLSKLNATRDFQAYGSANRAILEIAVDLSLLHQDKTNYSGWKMWWWGLSEKLQGAEQIIRFFTEQNLDVPDTYSEQQNFIDREKAQILEMRKILWNGKHPKRWTGNGNLFDDLVIADNFLGKTVIEILDKTLTEYYRTEYKKMNWYIHSGVASFWNMSKEFFPLLSAFFLRGCADFAILSTKIVFQDFGLNEHSPTFKQDLENLHFERLESHFRNIELKFSDIL